MHRLPTGYTLNVENFDLVFFCDLFFCDLPAGRQVCNFCQKVRRVQF